MAGADPEPYGLGMSDFRVVICGGGIAAVEGLLRLRRLAGDSVDIELIAPNEELVYRPMAVREPFAFGPPRRYPLRRIARDTRRRVDPGLAGVGRPGRAASSTPDREDASSTTHSWSRSAPGRSRPTSTSPRSATPRPTTAYHGIVQDVEGGYSRRLAFIQPVGPVWPLPLYELALMTAERAESMDIRDLELVHRDTRAAAACGLRHRCQRRRDEPTRASRDQGLLQLAREGPRRTPAASSSRRASSCRTSGSSRCRASPALSVRGLPGAGAHGFIADRQALRRSRHRRAGVRRRRRGQLPDQARRARRADGRRGGGGDRRAGRRLRRSAPAFNPVIRGKLLTGRGSAST